MRIIFTTILISCFTLAWGNDDKSYTINGTVDDEEINGIMIYLTDYSDSRIIDSALVVEGKFAFVGSYEHPTMLRVEDKNHIYYANILAEKTPVTVTLAPRSVVSPSGINGEFTKMLKQMSSISDEIRGIKDSLSNIYTNKDELTKVINDYSKNYNKQIMLSYLNANRDNSLGAFCAHQVIRQKYIHPAQHDSLLNEIPLIKNYGPITRAYNTIKKQEQLKPGTQFKDFTAKNVDGTPGKLSDYVGKGEYVLVEFWGSWCGPCSAKLPTLKYIHDTYPNLVVLGINVEDSIEKFLSYLKDNDIQWSMLYCDDDEATEMYGIDGVPATILFDPQGIIVDRSINKNNMKDKIAELFKE